MPNLNDNMTERLNIRFLVGVCLIALFACALNAQQAKRNSVYMNYIYKHSDEAISQMKYHKIPASITMAQGLLETGAGTSSLAVEHNNHFGIKCHKTWTGPRAYRDDDRRNECFRSYSSWRDSYKDHSIFLKQARYRELFRLAPDDYRGWAKGLQQCGYATDRGYANRLIKIVEDYELYALDKGYYPSWYDGGKSFRQMKSRNDKYRKSSPLLRDAYLSYNLLYVLAEDGDTFQSIADDMGMKPHKLAKYNDAPEDFVLKKGDVVYLQAKHNRAEPPYYTYVVRVGDSMHSIAQRFGVKMSKLYKMNNADGDYLPLEGDVLRLR
ncbi:glucosaminidase domain-containing protein [Porphyromonas macacae]|uniref:Peptidoglycan hydrolase n=1 Tax=Porphyromonas macacae TaxID=28115 RepID=A0A379DEU9_9PORP|nr:glucosaminidase domain-containing protein [Porphyromonas macacae]SUB76906.1 Exo-glucosaminidase lytG precursor [Porphyromonas macacae]